MMVMDARKKMAGLTMIEILVTLVVLSIGLLSIAALQITGIRSANGSVHRTQATILTDDLAERMRANRVAVYDNRFAAVDSALIDCATPPNPYCSSYFNGGGFTAAQNCTAAQMAAYDINTWFCGELNNGGRSGGVIASIPQASATVTCTDIDPPSGPDGDVCTDRLSMHTITINWNEANPDASGNGAATVNQSVSITVQ